MPFAGRLRFVVPILLCAGLVGFTLPGSSRIAGAAPAVAPSGRTIATIGGNINMSKQAGYQGEPAIAINPTNPQNIVAVSNDQSGSDRLWEGVTFNGGGTWVSRFIGGSTDLTLGPICCDPQLRFDSFGNLFMAYMDSSDQKIQLGVSVDGGLTFQPMINVRTRVPKSAADAIQNTKNKTLAAGVDQPHMDVGHNSIWLCWNIGAGGVEASGAAVTGLGQVGSFSAPQVLAGSSLGDFGNIAIGPQGQVFAVYQNQNSGNGPDTLRANYNPGGLGGTFGPLITISPINVGGFFFIPAQNRRSIDAESKLSWDRSGGPHNGRLYLSYTDRATTGATDYDTNILLRYSDDNGTTWTAPKRVNDDATTNSQFFQALAVDQSTGNVALSWYDARNAGSANNTVQEFFSYSLDGGVTWQPNFQVAAGSSNAANIPNSNEYGDYSYLDFHNGIAFPVWIDNSNSTGDNPDGTQHNSDVYTARIALSASMPVPDISATADGSEMFFAGRSPTNELWYQETAGGAFSGWQKLAPSGVASRPKAVNNGTSLFVFYRGTDTNLHYFVRTGGAWSGDVNLGGAFTSAPAAAIDGNGDLLVAGFNTIGETFFDRLPHGAPAPASAASWTGLTDLHGTLVGYPDMSSYNGDIYLLGINSAGLLFYNQWSQTTLGFGGWNSLDGVLSSPATSAASGTSLYVSGVNPQGVPFYRSLTGGTWSAWAQIPSGASGGAILSGATSTTSTSSTLLVLATNPGGSLYDQRRTGGSWLSGWENLDGTIASSPEAAGIGTRAYAFVISGDGSTWYRVWDGTSWGAYVDLGGNLATG